MKTKKYLNQPLSIEEIIAIQDYMKPGGAVMVNQTLRGQRKFEKKSFEKICVLLKALQKIPQVPLSINQFHNQVYRESEYFPGGISNPKDLKKSRIYVDKAFLSTSSDRFGVLPSKYKITIIRPKFGRDISQFGSTKSNEIEDEVLFPPNTSYQFLGYDSKSNRYIYTTDF